MPHIVALVALTICVASCNKSSDGTTARQRPNACTTPEAVEVTHQPDFESVYTYCTTGSRAVPPPALIACLENRSGLPEQCGSCYSYYKACTLRNCFNACYTTRPEPTCLLCARNFCSGQFGRCGGSYKVFPGSSKADSSGDRRLTEDDKSLRSTL